MKWKKLLRRAAPFLITLVALELGGFIGSIVIARKVAFASTLFALADARPYGQPCRWGDYVGPHPYLGYHYRRAPGGCEHQDLNQMGLQGPELGWRKDPDYYTVLVLGGSVAEQLAGHADNPIQQALRRDWISPTGKPFRVLSAAIAGGQQPMQAIAFLLLHELADAVVTLEGFNEHWGYVSRQRLEAPPHIYDEINGVKSSGYGAMLWEHAAHDLFDFFGRNWLLRRSWTAFFVGRSLSLLAEKHGQENPIGRDPALPPFPADQPPEEHRRLYLAQYRKYLDDIHTLAEQRGMKSLFFLQPVPAIAKPLTANDRAVVGDLSYGPRYREMVDFFVGTRELPMVSLLDLFKDFKDDLFIDHIHFRGPEGNRILGEAMVRHMGEAWKLARRERAAVGHP